MAMKIRFNLDNIVSRAVHGHCYLRVDGNEASNSKYVSDVEREKGIYSSPRNIRKLFIKNSGVDIVYYRPVVGKGDVLSESIRFNSDDKKLLSAAYEYYDNKFNGNQGYVEEISITGTGFSAFRNDLSVSNIEELYFDWSMLLGNENLFAYFYSNNQKITDYAVYGLDMREYEFFTSVSEIRKTNVKKLQADMVDMSNDSVMTLLLDYIAKEMCGNRPGGLAVNYPRLKYIGLIGNSNYVLKSDGGMTKKNMMNYEFNAIYNSFSDIKQLKEQLCAGDRFKYSLFVDLGVDLLSAPFRVDSGLYLFDEQYLNEYLKGTESNRDLGREEELTRYFMSSGDTKLGIESKLNWIKKFRAGELQRQRVLVKRMNEVKRSVEDATPKVDAVPKTEIEKRLAQIYRTDGELNLKITLKCLEMQYGKDNLINEISKFSEAGRDFYMAVYKMVEE